MKPTGEISNETGGGKDWPINPGKRPRTLADYAATLDNQSRRGLLNAILDDNSSPGIGLLNVMPVAPVDQARPVAVGRPASEAEILARRREQMAHRLNHLGLTEADVSGNPGGDYLWEQHIMSYGEPEWWRALEDIPNRLRRAPRDNFSREINRALPPDDATDAANGAAQYLDQSYLRSRMNRAVNQAFLQGSPRNREEQLRQMIDRAHYQLYNCPPYATTATYNGRPLAEFSEAEWGSIVNSWRGGQ